MQISHVIYLANSVPVCLSTDRDTKESGNTRTLNRMKTRNAGEGGGRVGLGLSPHFLGGKNILFYFTSFYPDHIYHLQTITYIS